MKRLILALLIAGGCAAPQKEEPERMSINGIREAKLCEHKVRESDCVKCHPELAANFKKIGDWCAEHDVPETQCLLCHPDLKFVELPPVPEGADYLHISRDGEDVETLEQHAAAGKVTIFDFYANWCAPCREVDAYMHELLGARTDIAYRKINIVNWDTPVAKRYLAQVPTLPYVVIYGKDGKRLREIAGLDLKAFGAAIDEGAAR
jgi:thiol-disulfide isomerase/thioredoxin